MRDGLLSFSQIGADSDRQPLLIFSCHTFGDFWYSRTVFVFRGCPIHRSLRERWDQTIVPPQTYHIALVLLWLS